MGFPFDWRDGRGSCSKDRQGGRWNLVWSKIVNCQIFEASDKQSCSGRYFTKNIQGVFFLQLAHLTFRTRKENNLKPFNAAGPRNSPTSDELQAVYSLLEKSRNGDTLGPVELNVWLEQGNQGDRREQDDQGEVSIIIFGMSESLGFQQD